MGWLGTCVVALLAQATPEAPEAWLAPDIRMYERRIRALEDKVARAEAIEVALARIHNRLAHRLEAGSAHCADEEGRSLVARSRAFGPALRDATQAARAEQARVNALRDARTVAPLLDDSERARADRLATRVALLHRRYLVASAWHRRLVERAAPCAPAAPLAQAPGLPGGAPASGPTAIIGVGGGLLCPDRVAADGVVVLSGSTACYGGDACTCTPAPVLPGAVVGP